jgi:phage virion morphogenesis protein
MTTNKAFPRDPQLTAIAIAYKNPDVSLIADAVLPRVPVGKETFKYWAYPDTDMYTIPDTKVGEKGRINTVELTGSELTAATEPRGISTVLTARDISEAPPGLDPKGRATEFCTNIVMLDRERDCANLVFDAAQYGAGNQDRPLSGGGATQWSDYATSDPIAVHAVDAPRQVPHPPERPRARAGGLDQADRSHPKVVSACERQRAATSGARPTRERLAELLELNEILVGASFVNSVKPGKAPTLQRVWGKHALAFYRDRTVSAQAGGVTFGFTAQYGTASPARSTSTSASTAASRCARARACKELIVAPERGLLLPERRRLIEGARDAFATPGGLLGGADRATSSSTSSRIRVAQLRRRTAASTTPACQARAGRRDRRARGIPASRAARERWPGRRDAPRLTAMQGRARTCSRSIGRARSSSRSATRTRTRLHSTRMPSRRPTRRAARRSRRRARPEPRLRRPDASRASSMSGRRRRSSAWRSTDRVRPGAVMRLARQIANLSSPRSTRSAPRTSPRRSTASRSRSRPNGVAWQALSAATLKKRGPNARILRDRGNLYDSITHLVAGRAVRIGTNRKNSRIHQLGGDTGREHKVHIPARPYLGISDEGRKEVLAILKAHVAEGGAS